MDLAPVLASIRETQEMTQARKKRTSFDAGPVAIAIVMVDIAVFFPFSSIFGSSESLLCVIRLIRFQI